MTTRSVTMALRPLSPYRGTLSAKDVADGINVAVRNARRLATDARILLDARRYPSAAALAILSMEESGKIPSLRALSLAHTPIELASAWGEYRRHRVKNAQWIASELAAKGAGHLTGFADAVTREREHMDVADLSKHLSLHTDCYNKGHWSEPPVAIDGNAATVLVNICEISCAKHEVSVREIELWMEYVGPAWQSNQMPEALLRWAQAMEKEGLGTPDVGDMEKSMSGPLADFEESPGGKKYRH
jgi:AbiV family abortive infection protein